MQKVINYHTYILDYDLYLYYIHNICINIRKWKEFCKTNAMISSGQNYASKTVKTNVHVRLMDACGPDRQKDA
jgi:hypothetical protein